MLNKMKAYVFRSIDNWRHHLGSEIVLPDIKIRGKGRGSCVEDLYVEASAARSVDVIVTSRYPLLCLVVVGKCYARECSIADFIIVEDKEESHSWLKVINRKIVIKFVKDQIEIEIDTPHQRHIRCSFRLAKHHQTCPLTCRKRQERYGQRADSIEQTVHSNSFVELSINYYGCQVG
jgi:hypothetical protein